MSVAAIQHVNPNASRDEKMQRVLSHSSESGAKPGWSREVRVSNLVSKMLCDGHNHGSSELDAAGGRFSDALRGFADLAVERKYTRLKWVAKRFDVDGPLVERWMMKTAINLMVGYREDLPIGSEAAEINRPHVELAEMVYGRRPVSSPYGVWYVTPLDGKTGIDDHFNIRHWRNGDVACGTLFTICGFRFAVSLSETEPPWAFLGRTIGWRRYQSVRHLSDLRQERIGAELRISWPASHKIEAKARSTSPYGH